MKETKERRALVIFGNELPSIGEKFDTIFAEKRFKDQFELSGAQFEDLESFLDSGSVYEAATLLEELPKLSLSDGTSIKKAVIYEGFDLWWFHYNSFFYNFCIPYTQYRRLLERLSHFESVSFTQLPYKNLFIYYLQAHGVSWKEDKQSVSRIPFGVLLQVILTIVSLPILALKKSPLLLSVGDKIEKGKDYDMRMKFVYEDIRKKNIPYVEFIRSLESWKTVLDHFFKRWRPVVYTEAVTYIAKFLSIIMGQRSIARSRFAELSRANDPETQFKLSIASHYLYDIYEDIWAIRLMKSITKAIGVMVVLCTAAQERNFSTILGSKLNNIVSIGVLHGVSSRYSTTYDYMNGFDGERMLSTDFYGLWSEWWMKHFIKNSDAYKPEQLEVSGPMRPFVSQGSTSSPVRIEGLTRVLIVSEQAAHPQEVLPYIEEVLKHSDIKLSIKFRAARDGFENWLLENHPDLLKHERIEVLKGGMQEAITNADVVIGCHSTGVLEALLQQRIPIFIYTKKWGDYFSMGEEEKTARLIAKNPEDLIQRIREAKNVSKELLAELSLQYFGDSTKNGSVWAVEKAEQFLK